MKKKNTEKLFAGLKVSYTTAEAKKEIDQILEPYGEEVRIVFGVDACEIIDSYKVRDADIRHRICEIIARSGVTKRDYEDLCAEWRFHNDAWDIHFKRASAKDVTLDYAGDPRRSVRFATAIYDALDHE